ncbi:hypothetical protein C8Q74DRAFT_1174340, partial [Fomes fomentarius]
RADSYSPFPKSTVASPGLVRGYDPNDGHCCGVNDFCLDLAGTPASSWNASATEVFVDDFLDCGQYNCTDRKKIAKMFRTHIRTLKHHHKNLGTATSSSNGSSKKQPKKAITAKDKARARYQRKYTSILLQLYHRRLGIARRFINTKKHIKILQRMGVESMSSDEEDNTAAFVRYRIFKKPWRHVRVTQCLRLLDALHRMWRAESGQASKRGSTQRCRFDGSNPPKPRLPKNAYDDAWLAARTPVELDKLKPNNAAYDFSHDEGI